MLESKEKHLKKRAVANKVKDRLKETRKKRKKKVDYEEEKMELECVDWESQSLGNMHVYKLIRADGNTSYYKTFESMLKSFDRHDLEGDLKILVDPEQDDGNLEESN
ncbi:hypothetical protein Tco_0800865 [Tanacetum coccineum]|uniref:Uncharacterized protein n=1 Tax=Tanacetum coccineum TaxID=301880 RepID=A0ABQ4ZYF5_9ASTR